MILLFLFLPCVFGFPQAQEDLFRGLFPIQPPHCAKTPIVIAQTSTNANLAISRAMQMQFYIGLHNTVCFRLDEGNRSGALPGMGHPSSWLHTIRLDKLEHHHPVSQRYEFGIPEVSADCICECSASETCSAETHQFTQCPEKPDTDMQTSCYRTFFANQAPIGCNPDASPRLCCDVKFRPHKNQTYTAVKIEQPTTYATFVYTAYDYSNFGWQVKDRMTINTQLDASTQEKFIDARRHVSLSVAAGGRASHQLETGMYFANSNPGGEMDELRRQPLNELTDNNFDRLGWYRRGEDGRFHVNNGVVKMDEIHKAKVKNCKDQTYRSILNANNYMPDKFNLSVPLEVLHPWIQSARIYDGGVRQVIVTHSEGTNLHITLQVNGGSTDGEAIRFFHNSSQVEDFSGTIIVDSRSNRYFNLTVYGASGKINGNVKMSTLKDSNDIYSFTTYVHDLYASNRSMIIPLPAIVESGARVICLRADEQDQEGSICRVIEYHESPLEIDVDRNTWREMIGTCPSCNQVSFNGFTKFLNPAAWINGITSLGDMVQMAVDIVVYVAVLAILFILIRFVVIPIVKCGVCPYSMLSKCLCGSHSKKKKDQKHSRQKESSKMSKKGSIDVGSQINFSNSNPVDSFV